MFITVEDVEGATFVIAPDKITHLTAATYEGTVIHFVSGEHKVTSRPIDELTLDLLKSRDR